MSRPSFSTLLLTVGLLAWVQPWVLPSTAISAEVAESGVGFEQNIQPVLKKHCARCHGSEKRSAGLSLASGSEILKGGESGEVIIPGMPDKSLLVQLVESGQMPPEGNEAPAPDEIALIRRWIADGAAMPTARPHGPAVTDAQIVPLMLLRCTVCHGGRRKEADLDLRTRAGMLRGGSSGPAVVSGDPQASLLVRRIHAEEMPPRRQLVSVSVKPMEAQELRMLEGWISQGLPEADPVPDVVTPENDREVSDSDREFWAFRPPVAVLPATESLTPDDLRRIRNPIDQFILLRLRMHGLTLSPEADRATLIRRLSFDLTGLPPVPTEVEAFVHDQHPEAYERLVDRLLDSPQYGERWARHWLDAAGYADSEGSQNEDRIRPDMWRYRDYVIRSFNVDKPYDRFLQEQLAGDELADYQHAPVITDEIYENLVATGFLRTAPDRTFAGITNFVPDRLEVVADEIQILGTAVMGLTLHCCRCHSHKFDPLPQRDYYRLAAALKDALDEHDWLGPQERHLKNVTTAERQVWDLNEKRIADQLRPLQEERQSTQDEPRRKALDEQIQRLEAERRPEPTIRALWSRGDPSPTFILKRGNYLTPGNAVEPGVPAVLSDRNAPFAVQPPWPGAATTGRRLALARWLTRPDHPLTARVMVNRIWKHHFGAGIVRTLANFGKTGAPPSHPELLDWLATEFVRNNWSLKAMHRLITGSATYRQSSLVSPDLLAADPDNLLLSRMPLRRIEAESLRDSLLFVSGRLDPTPFGPPDSVEESSEGLITVKASDKGGRRSIYVLHRRTKLPTILEAFDSPQMGPNCLERGESVVAPQALHLLNNATVYELAGHFAARVRHDVGTDPRQQIIRVHETAFGTAPTSEEMTSVAAGLAQLTSRWQQALSESQSDADPALRALQNYCHAVMNSAAFVYVD